jgi:hypothetical protein
MNRRSFLRSMFGGVAAAAAVRTFPFRVFSFPKEIVVPAQRLDNLTLELLQDSAFDIEAFLRVELSRRMARELIRRLDLDLIQGQPALRVPVGVLSDLSDPRGFSRLQKFPS